MKNNAKRNIAVFLLLFLPISFTFQSCSKDDILDTAIDYLTEILNQTGWLVDDENMDDIPEDITPYDDNTTTLADKADLESKFPPIGDQGSYGTCVAWSVGYNLKTSLNAIEKGWDANKLASTANQTSPKDLWMNISSSDKGSNCGGTNFEPALDALIASGVASMSAAPYTNLGNCSGTATTPDASNKLANYRKIAFEDEKLTPEEKGLTPENFKGYLNAGRPIAIGAQLGDRFMDWNSSAVITSDTWDNPGMQHAYHAMVLVGYDDSKQAFRVRNSWGKAWGDNGSIWVGYTFFCEKFCFAAFVAQNVNSISAGTDGIEKPVDGTDLLAYFATDESLTNDPDGYTRLCTYKAYNSGTTNILAATKDWSITYMYYNAKDATKYEILFEDRYTSSYGNKGEFGDLPSGASDAIYGGFWNYVDVASGQLVGEENFPDGTEVFYNLPATLTGEYYLVVMVDAFDDIKEVNEDNNFYFITAANGKPLNIVNGVINNMAKSALLSKSAKRPALFSNGESQTVVKPGNLNAYTPSEIKAMLLYDKKTGKLDAKLKKFRTKGGNNKVKRVRA